MKNVFTVLFMCLFVVMACKDDKPTTSEPVEEPSSAGEYEDTKFVYNGTLDWPKDLVRVANCVLRKQAVYTKLSEKSSFDFTDHDGAKVANAIKYGPQSELKIYRSNVLASWWRRAMPGQGNVNAYTLSGSTDIFFNSRVNPRSTILMLKTMCHEFGHVVGYGHGGNGTHTTGVPNDMETVCAEVYKEGGCE